MNKRNNIIIKTIQNDIEEIWESDGLLSKEDDMYIIKYPDYAGNTQTDNRLDISKDKMHLTRWGAFNSDMFFEENMMTVGKYGVMFFNSSIEVFTKAYDFTEDEIKIQVEIEYQILEAGNEIANNKMVITIDKV